MNKKVFGLLLVVLLVGIVSVNIIQDVREKKEIEKAIEEYNKKGEHIEQFSHGLAAGDAPPDFELKTLDGETVKLSDYKGKKVILNFWASWCPPCKAEMPYMEKYYKTKAGDQNVEIIAVNLTSDERGNNKLKKVEDFIKEYQLTFPIPLDEEGEMGHAYKIFTIPTTFLIDTNGLIHNKIVGPMDEEMIETLVSDMD